MKIVDKPQPPSPDFIIEDDKKLIGLEHTRIITDNAKRYFSIISLLDKAELRFEEKYPNINVLAIISVRNDQWDYKLKDKKKIANQIADFVQLTRCGSEFKLPEKITQIRTMNHPQVSFTYNEQNRQTEYLTKERLKIEILKKEGKISGYQKSKKKLEEFWLVLLIGSSSSVSYKLDESENYQMESKFDRVYLMEDFKARIIRIK